MAVTGTPERVLILGVETGDEGVGVRHGHHPHEPRRVHHVQCVIQHEPAERAACLLDRWLSPEPGRQRLLVGPARTRARADQLRLVVVTDPPPAVERRRRSRPELIGGLEAERPHQSEVRPDRGRCRRREPDAGDRRVRRRVRHGGTEAVVGTLGDEQVRDQLPGRDAVRLRLSVIDREPAKP